MSIYHENSLTPTSLAARFAKYMTDPSTVRARVKDHFGRAPSVQQCANLIQAARKTERREYYFRDTRLYENFKCDHEQDDTNLLLKKNGEYVCLTCHKERRAKEEQEAKDRACRWAAEKRKELARKQAEEEARKLALEARRKSNPLSASSRPKEVAGMIRATARVFGITVADVLGHDRNREFTKARMVLCVALKERGHSYPRIAGFTNRICHTSIRHLCNEFPERSKRDPFLLTALAVVRGQ